MTANPDCKTCAGTGKAEAWIKDKAGGLVEIRFVRCDCTYHPIQKELEADGSWSTLPQA